MASFGSKILSVLLALFMLFGLLAQTGCAGTPDETTPADTTAAGTPAEMVRGGVIEGVLGVAVAEIEGQFYCRF